MPEAKVTREMEGAGSLYLGRQTQRSPPSPGRALPVAADGENADAVGYFQPAAQSSLTQSALSLPETAKAQPVPPTAP